MWVLEQCLECGVAFLTSLNVAIYEGFDMVMSNIININIHE